mmetsp:Transcript_7333/g.13903  ORF Transcript_7333/g.13903 Transcript_7333/m.13903 type:complete len:247 (+) Transcript_7333:59-799(+)|eukprot:CAMPEP_0175088570 /NCGR_PEP_ID=MMETSP0086_2-20121207/317_1 /TAXON_ID=136419 /ORGANISM="Unknown Unknown, Strain D1" /LENGTH=246 /DNA_ID=CAMNT_0016361009 /DNA_START=9 /DNA_END=749 /DNA_ORIENTATION=-
MARVKKVTPKAPNNKIVERQYKKKMDDIKKKSLKKSNPTASKKTKKIRFRPGTVALRMIRKYQKNTDLLLRKAPLKRLILQIRDHSKQIINLKLFLDITRIQAGALEAIQNDLENFLVQTFENANEICIHAKRVTVMQKDLDMVVKKVCQADVSSDFEANTGSSQHGIEEKLAKCLTRPAVQRLARRGGVKRLNKTVYTSIREIAQRYLTNLLHKVSVYTLHSGRKTVSTSDVIYGLKACNRVYYG